MSKILMIALFFAASVASAQGEETPLKTARAVVGGDGIQRVSVVGGSYFFHPEHIIVKANVPVELSVRKESGMVPHDMVVKAPEAGIEFAEKLTDQPKIIRFTPSRAGSYPIYCSKKLLFLKSHRDKGMKGVLQVEE